MNGLLHPVLDKLGFDRKGKRVGLHGFHHFLGSVLMKNRGTLVAQKQLRHADSSTTVNFYGHLFGDERTEALQEVESVLRDK